MGGLFITTGRAACTRELVWSVLRREEKTSQLSTLVKVETVAMLGLENTERVLCARTQEMHLQNILQKSTLEGRAVLKTYRKSLYRQVAEAVKIYGSQATIVLNSKAEWHQPSIDRVMVTRDLPERQQVRRIGA